MQIMNDKNIPFVGLDNDQCVLTIQITSGAARLIADILEREASQAASHSYDKMLMKFAGAFREITRE